MKSGTDFFRSCIRLRKVFSSMFITVINIGLPINGNTQSESIFIISWAGLVGRMFPAFTSASICCISLPGLGGLLRNIFFTNPRVAGSFHRERTTVYRDFLSPCRYISSKRCGSFRTEEYRIRTLKLSVARNRE
jgi:hypothetical protein